MSIEIPKAEIRLYICCKGIRPKGVEIKDTDFLGVWKHMTITV